METKQLLCSSRAQPFSKRTEMASVTLEPPLVAAKHKQQVLTILPTMAEPKAKGFAGLGWAVPNFIVNLIPPQNYGVNSEAHRLQPVEDLICVRKKSFVWHQRGPVVKHPLAVAVWHIIERKKRYLQCSKYKVPSITGDFNCLCKCVVPHKWPMRISHVEERRSILSS